MLIISRKVTAEQLLEKNKLTIFIDKNNQRNLFKFKILSVTEKSSNSMSISLEQQQHLSYKEIEEKVKKAKDEKKIFIIHYGYNQLRNSLFKRGWLEKVQKERIQFMNGQNENYIIANILKNSSFYFIWQPKNRPIKMPQVNPPILVNSVYRRTDLDFTSKEGLMNIEKNMNWFTIEGISQLQIQRTYVISHREGREEFREDFKRTNFTNFIMFLAKSKGKNFKSFFSDADDGISYELIELALTKINILLRIKEHDDIDSNYIVESYSRFETGKDPKEKLMKKIISGSKKFRFPTETKLNELLKSVTECAEKIKLNWPERKYDGYKNVWIVKKVGSSSGYGVSVLANDREILKHSMTNSSRFIVQKYIERPMLIEGRKFDIRIYFMTHIRDGFVDLWIYRDCYFKFGTHKFNLDQLDRSIHITNYAVQKFYMNDKDAVTNSIENMWPLKEFLRHLKFIEKPDLWKDNIFPQIKQNLIACLMQSLETTTIEVNNFELNGADFMITYNYETVLIEINSKPDLFFSSKVIEMITGKLQEDIIKVLIDFQADITSLTGDFELAHVFEIPQFNENINLSVDSRKVNLAVRKASDNNPLLNSILNSK